MRLSKIRARIPATAPLLPTPAPDPDEPNVIPLPPPSPAIELTPLLGNAPSEHIRTLHSLYASQAASLVWASDTSGLLEVERKDVVVGVALHRHVGTTFEGSPTEHEREVFHGVMAMVKEVVSRE